MPNEIKCCLFCEHASYVPQETIYYSTLTGSDTCPAYIKCAKQDFSFSLENSEDFCNIPLLFAKARECETYQIKQEIQNELRS